MPAMSATDVTYQTDEMLVNYVVAHLVRDIIETRRELLSLVSV